MQYSVDYAVERFKAILEAKTSWASLAGSQFVEHLAVFASWALRAGQFAVERARQEFFTSTAINRSSIIAHAENREYLPQKPKCSTGKIVISNEGNYPVSIPSGTTFITSSEVTLTTSDAVNIDGMASAVVNVEQKSSLELDYEISSEEKFHEILIPASVTGTLSEFTVSVDSGTGYEEWEYSRLLQNAYYYSKVYDEFYATTEQVGIRFGDGTLGMMPPADSNVKVELWLTEGDTFFAAGQEVYLSADILDSKGEVASIKSFIDESISGGSSAEETEEIRKSLHYWQTYNDQIVWDGDYIFFMKRLFPEIAWVNVWGEREAEKQAGALDLDFINTIFVSVYAQDGKDIASDILEALENKAARLNRRFKMIDPVHVKFTVSVSGAVESSRNVNDVQNAVMESLLTAFGADSSDRKETVLIKDIYAVIEELGFFDKSGEYFEVEITGKTKASLLEEFVSIDEVSSTVTIAYL